MIENLISAAESLIEQFGFFGIFLASLTEEVIAPIPSGLVMMSAGYAFLSGSSLTFGNFVYLVAYVAIPLSLGLTLGSFVVYGIAYKFGEPIIRKVGPWIGVNWNDIMKIHRRFDKSYRDEITLLILRLIPVLPSVAINAVAGLVKFNFRAYILITLLGTLVRATLISLAGWQLGNVYKEYAATIDNWSDLVLYAIIAIVIGFILWRKFEKK